MTAAYWWDTRVKPRYKRFAIFCQTNLTDLCMFGGWVLVTWALVQGSARGWAASLGLYLLSLVAIEAATNHYARLRAERNRGPQ